MWKLSRKNVKLSRIYTQIIELDSTRFLESQKSSNRCPIVTSFSINSTWCQRIYVKIITK